MAGMHGCGRPCLPVAVFFDLIVIFLSTIWPSNSMFVPDLHRWSISTKWSPLWHLGLRLCYLWSAISPSSEAGAVAHDGCRLPSQSRSVPPPVLSISFLSSSPSLLSISPLPLSSPSLLSLPPSPLPPPSPPSPSQGHLKGIFSCDKGWRIDAMGQSTFLENIPMVKIVKGVRSFEPVTPSPCIVMCATRPRPLAHYVVAGGLAVTAACALVFALRRRG